MATKHSSPPRVQQRDVLVRVVKPRYDPDPVTLAGILETEIVGMYMEATTTAGGAYVVEALTVQPIEALVSAWLIVLAIRFEG